MSSDVNVTEENASAPGGSLYIKVWTPPLADALPPVILFHDSIGCVDMWRQFPCALAIKLRRRVIAYDRLGYGKSSPRDDSPSACFVSEEAATFFPVVRERFGLSRYVLFGHSVGGSMAVAVAALFPGECVALVTEAAQAYVEPKTLDAIRAAKEKFSMPSELAKLEKYHGTRARWVVSAWTGIWLSQDFANWSLLEVLPMVSCPLLAIHGDQDEYGSNAFPQILSTMTASYAEKFIVPACGHVPHRERMGLLLDTVSDFLGRCT